MHGRKTEPDDSMIQNIVFKSMEVYPLSGAINPLIITPDLDTILNLRNVPEYDENFTKCSSCNAFFNAYSLISDHPSVWKCSLCGKVNTLPLTPSNSFNTGFSLAQKSIPYNNVIFDYVEKPKNYKEEKNCFIIVIQSSLSHEIMAKIAESIDDKSEDDYILIFFNYYIEVFDSISKTLKAIYATSTDIFLPITVDQMKINATQAKQIINSYKSHVRNDSNLSSLSLFLNEFSLNVPARIALFAQCPFPTFSTELQIPAYVCIIGFSDQNLGHAIGFCSKFGSKYVYLPDSDLTKIYSFATRCFRDKVVKDLTLQYYLPKESNRDIRLFKARNGVVARTNFTGALLSMIVQTEMTWTEKNGKKVIRVITMKVRLSFDSKVYRTATFKFPFRCVFAASSYMIEEINKCLDDQKLFQIRAKILEIAYKYPLEILFKEFVFGLFRSRLIDEKTEHSTRIGLGQMLVTLPAPNIFLYFVPLDYVNGKVEPAVPVPHKNAIARISYQVLYIKDTVEDPNSIAEEIAKKMDLVYIDVIIKVVSELPSVKDFSKEFKSWSENWDKNVLRFNVKPY